jgi:hypothetical protein
MSKQYDWLELKIKFMTGDYKSIREFSKEQDIPYNRYFKEKTKGWIQERDAKLSELCWEISKDSMTKKVEEYVELKQAIDEAGAELYCLIDDFIKNKDYSKFPLKQRTGGTVELEIAETPYIKINEINKAVNSLNKLYKILLKTYPTLTKIQS